VAEINFLEKYQKVTERNYVQRVLDDNKAACATVAKKWGKDYWDGERKYGYGGYHYDGRWIPIAKKMAKHFDLKDGDKVLDIGCGKAFLLYELTQVVPGLKVHGLDISEYGLAQAKEEISAHLKLGDCVSLPWEDNSFDFVFSINTFHNLEIYSLEKALKEMQRVSKSKAWLCVESYRNEVEKANLLYWQITCMSFYSTVEWNWIYKMWGYKGDYGFIFFE
jgi:protein-L-isoaspartate(D-aspartate) O-methyltransferase